jgi:hypothetical protein
MAKATRVKALEAIEADRITWSRWRRLRWALSRRGDTI